MDVSVIADLMESERKLTTERQGNGELFTLAWRERNGVKEGSRWLSMDYC